VIATARGEARAWIESFGASETIDFAERPVAGALADAHPDGIYGVLDLVGNAEQVTGAAQHVRDAGTVVSTAFGVTDELSSQSRITEVALASGAAAITSHGHGGARGKTLIRI
jgi:Zn-dependent alcohol dehydrogenase